jgi:hypothetical protein
MPGAAPAQPTAPLAPPSVVPAGCLQVPSCEVLIHDMDRSDTVAGSLLRLAQVKQVDTLVLGISGYG